jgi:phage/plasmid-like protein (TIGR03299 family)
MSHEITIRTDGTAEAAFSLVPAWHGLGITVAEPVSIADLFAQAQLGWGVETTPLYMKNADGTESVMPGTSGIRRTDSGYGLGTASDGYVPFQNSELLSIAEEVFGYAKIGETAFSLRGGQETVLTLNLGTDAIAVGKVQDEHKSYLLLGVGHTGARPVYALGTDTRVVCANTLRIAVGAGNKTLAREGVTIRHSSKMTERVAALVSALKDIKEGQEANFATFRSLVQSKMNKDARLAFYGKVVDYVLPAKTVDLTAGTPAALEAVKETLRDKRRADMLALILGFSTWETEANGLPGDSAYTAYQAVSDAVEHSIVSTKGKDETRNAESRFISRMSGKGDAIKQFAFASLASQA